MMSAPVDSATDQPTLSESAAQRRFRVFAVLWALGGMAHLTNNEGQGFEHPAGWLTLIAAVYLISSPGSVRRLVLFAAVQLTEVIILAPFWADHQLLMAAVNLSILVRAAQLWRAEGSRAFDEGREGEFIARHASTMQVLMLIAYSGAALAKYNTTFLDPLTSCATYITEIASGGLIDQGGSTGRLHVLSALVPETVIPLLLVAPATRRFGVRFAVLFHFFVSGSPFVAVEDFTLVLYPLFLLFLPTGDIDAIAAWARRQLLSGTIASGLRRFRPEVVRTLLASAGIVALSTQGGGYWLLLFWLSGLAVGLVLLGLLVTTLFQAANERPRIDRLPIPQIGVAVVLTIFVLSPYIGLRTAGVFTMFSNLQTSGPGTNHIFMPSWDLIDHQNDLVVPATGSSSEFDEIIEDGYALHYFELQRILADDPDARLVGTRNGVPFDTSTADLGAAPSVLERKLLQFRTVPNTGEPLCTN